MPQQRLVPLGRSGLHDPGGVSLKLQNAVRGWCLKKGDKRRWPPTDLEAAHTQHRQRATPRRSLASIISTSQYTSRTGSTFDSRKWPKISVFVDTLREHDR
jgi:hypothetical protein